uniref:Uncharacterized protein n=1 Tax=Sphenodon punctatus TaxID=8508 RepID=A0A8D0HLI7_SPHPU
MSSCGYIPSCPAPSCGVPCGPRPLNNLAPLCGDLSGCGSICGPVNTSCVSQIPATQMTVQPPCFCITIPGPIMSASCDPVAVGGNTPCARGSYGSSGYGVCRPC